MTLWGGGSIFLAAGCSSCGRETASQFGLYDIHGDVLEWCEDYSNGTYEGAPSDGSAWRAGHPGNRVIRGGSRCYGPGNLRAAYRLRDDLWNRDLNIGLGVAGTL
jgi:formylglycine-generating enzyme required for sulfatase activity